MRIRLAASSLALAVALCAATAWALSWPFEKAVYLAPIIVAAAGAVVGLLVFWARVVYVQVRDSPNRRLLIWLGAAFVALVVVLTGLGARRAGDRRGDHLPGGALDRHDDVQRGRGAEQGARDLGRARRVRRGRGRPLRRDPDEVPRLGVDLLCERAGRRDRVRADAAG